MGNVIIVFGIICGLIFVIDYFIPSNVSIFAYAAIGLCVVLIIREFELLKRETEKERKDQKEHAKRMGWA